MTRFAAGVTALFCALISVPLLHGPAQAATLTWPVPSELALPAFDTSFYLLVAPHAAAHPRPGTSKRTGSRAQGATTAAPQSPTGTQRQMHRPEQRPVQTLLFFIPRASAAPDPTARSSDRGWPQIFQWPVLVLIPAPQNWTFWVPAPLFGPADQPPQIGLGFGVGKPSKQPVTVQAPVVAGQSPAPVPLPGSAILLAAALAFGVFFGRRRA